MNKKYTVAVAGTGYVGLSIATLLAQNHKVYAVDIVPEKVEMINRRQSPIQDEYIEQYFATYPKVKEYLDNLVESAKNDGYITTMFGRRRPIPELSSSNFMQRAFGERIAMNSPLQGTAADIMKIAMIRVYERMKKENLKSKMILQVHDEVIVDMLRTEQEAVIRIVRESMEGVAQLSVPLISEAGVGENWLEAH